MKPTRTVGMALAAAALAASPPLAAQTTRINLLLTRPERTAYRETSRYEDVAAFLARLERASRRVHVTSMGYTTEGRAIPLVVVGKVADASPEAVRRTGLTRVYIQGNIHAGEVEGKEAALMLLRDLAAGRHAAWLDSLVLLVAPIYNADGNERVSLGNRPLQNGPIGGMGQRENAQGLDLNRDHTKLESPEARSQASLLTRYDPEVAIDLHTTDGSIHGYHLTYAEPLHPATDPAIIALLRSQWLPAVTRALKSAEGWDLFYYGNTPSSSVERGGGGRERGWYTFDYRPRYSENYWGVRNRLGILSEAYSYASFEERIRATLRFLEASLSFAHDHAGAIRGLVVAADARAIVGDSLPVRARLHRGDSIVVLLGEVAEERHPYTGERVLRRLAVSRPERMPDFTTFEGTEFSRVPRAYVVPERLASVIERLAAHGVRTVRVELPLASPVERFRIDSTWTAAQPFQGHRERTVLGVWERDPADTIPPGSVLVPVDQPLGRLVFLLLEPRSDDGFLDWNLLDDVLAGARYYPIRRMPAPAGQR